jgi:metal-responsive CopG/Arc/MetJ family transcriptional regulator
MDGDRKQLHVLLDEALIRRLDDYRFANRFTSRTDAIRWLLDWSLARNPNPERPQEKRENPDDASS